MPQGIVLERRTNRLPRDDYHQRLAEQVEWALSRAGYRELRHVSLVVEGRRVVLAGVVPTYYLKQIAQTAVLTVPGVCSLHNGIAVRPTTASREFSACDT